MKTVTSICFRDNHSMSMDVERVQSVDVGKPLKVEDEWFCEIIIRTDSGVIGLQLLADAEDQLKVVQAEDEEDLSPEAEPARPVMP